ncbi:DinB family protein [Pontibacillus sp. HMF3514]|uniref:DinB family protein n=1 Tax=Pontibacillus sp. HMF3514 TaxID=2692425 RepID=UPI00131FAFAA|nr:DinB family protein [Pontibacillus sp. HMF3514]QHE50812.1 DUF1569 domain-containing protein [Pontibacillus sp. HMF3514]
MYGLEEKRNQILEFLQSLTDDQARTKPSDESWSILEVLEHLYLIEGFVVQQMANALEKGSDQQAELKPIHRTQGRDYKVEAPEYIQPKGQFESIQDAKDHLEKSREQMLFLIHNKDQELLQNRVMPHPAFGDMNLEQWAEFIGWHEIRHLEQIQEIKEAL